MSMEYNVNSFGSSTGVLAFPEHYVAIGVKHAKADSGTPGLATLVGTKYIVKAGTIYPANDATAIGVVMNDVDVTNGDGMLAVIVHGFIRLSKVPVVPASAAISAMKMISFLPIVPFLTVSLSCTKKAVAAGATPDDFTVDVSITNGTFRAEAGTLTNWTISGATTVKLNATAVVLSEDKKTATFTVESTAAAAAGNLTVRPDADVIDVNSQPAAVIIATVA